MSYGSHVQSMLLKIKNTEYTTCKLLKPRNYPGVKSAIFRFKYFMVIENIDLDLPRILLLYHVKYLKFTFKIQLPIKIPFLFPMNDLHAISIESNLECHLM